MKSKLFLLIATMLVLVACNSNEPSSNTSQSSESTIEQLLIGSWILYEVDFTEEGEYHEDHLVDKGNVYIYTYYENGIGEYDITDKTGDEIYNIKGKFIWELKDKVLYIDGDGQKIRSINEKEMVLYEENKDGTYIYIWKRYKQ